MRKAFKSTLALFISLLFLFVVNSEAIANTVDNLNSQISNKKSQIDEIEKSQSEIEGQLKHTHDEQNNLESQIAVIEGEITHTENEIKKTQLEIEKLELEITRTSNEIKIKTDEVNNQKTLLREYLKVMQQYDSQSPIQMLFGNNSLSEVLDQIEYLETLEGQSQETLDEIQELKQQLEWDREVLIAKNNTQIELREELSQKKAVLDDEKSAKDRLLEETQLEEEKYQELLEESKRDYAAAQNEIAALEAQIQEELKKSEVQERKPDDFVEFSSSGELSWPVYPKRGISAYFRDQSYFNYFGVHHSAIDIPAPQGTTIYAPADGYVVKYRNAGYGYSYLVLHHGNGLSTVYGHIPASLVSAGQFVKRGDPVALVGGTPGTPGAGWMTTGPHLHFETRVNGKAVNPMQFLPGL